MICFAYIGLSAITRTVDIAGAGQYTSIQTAVTASSSGDTVMVYPGVYLENVNVSLSNITIVSLEYTFNDPSYIESTIIDGSMNSPGIKINQNIQNIRIRGFSITNGKSGIVLGQNSTTTITNCYIYGNASSFGGGINLFKCTTVMSGLRIFNNYSHTMGGGLYIYGYMGSVNVTFDPINRCSIYNNTAGSGQDIVAHSINNDLSIPLDMFTVPNPSSYYAAAFRAWGNEFQLLFDIRYVHHQEINSDFYVSPNGDDANDGLSPSTALKTIRTAIYRVASDSLNQKTVHILPGTYSLTANQQIFPIALKSWVKVIGAGIESTQIIGEPEPILPNQSIRVFATFYQNHISLEEMSITSENSNNSCAIWGYREDYVNLKNLRMHDLSPNDNAVINIVFATNCLWDNITVEDIETTQLGFLYIDGCLTGVIQNSTFRNGISNFTSDEIWARPLIGVDVGPFLKIENTIFSNITMMDDDSQAITFGGISNSSFTPYYSIKNCLFSNINCNVRAVLLQGNNYPVIDITNCTFAGQSGNGEALMVNGIVTIANSVFHNNRSVEIAINPMDGSGIITALTLNNNLIRNGYYDVWQAPGSTINYSDTNISGNPLFAGGDDIHNPLFYSLSAGSPCINTGTPDTTGLDLPPYDLAGNYRIWNNRIDMGCYEYGSEPWVSNDDPVSPEIPAISLTAYPNPFSAFTNIKVNLQASEGNGMESMNDASITIYNLKGQKVKSIKLDPRKPGEQLTYWDGMDADNVRCSSGIYCINLMVNGRSVSSKKVTLIR